MEFIGGYVESLEHISTNRRLHLMKLKVFSNEEIRSGEINRH